MWIGAAPLYPYVLEYASLVSGSYPSLLGFDAANPLYAVILFLGPAVMVALAVLIAARWRLASPGARLTPGT